VPAVRAALLMLVLGLGLLLAGLAMGGGCSLVLDFDGTLVDATVDAAVADAGPDAEADAMADASLDAASNARIACGTAQCVVGAQICCRVGATQTCQPRTSSCAGVASACDGTEDCPGAVCCAILPSILECRVLGLGADRCSGRIEDSHVVACNDTGDCNVQRPICQQCTVSGSPLKYCTAVLTTGCTTVP
jgi:hypothetical protein